MFIKICFIYVIFLNIYTIVSYKVLNIYVRMLNVLNHLKTLKSVICNIRTGIGFGFMYLPAIVMVGFYFEKRRAFATGVAVCGSGIGGFIFAPMCNYLLEEFGWKGATWIVAAIVLNGVVCGAVFRPLERTVSYVTVW